MGVNTRLRLNECDFYVGTEENFYYRTAGFLRGGPLIFLLRKNIPANGRMKRSKLDNHCYFVIVL